MEGDGNRSCPSKQEWRGGQEQERGSQNRSERVHMLQWIEGDAALAISRVVSELSGGVCVCGLMKGDGEKDRQDPR